MRTSTTPAGSLLFSLRYSSHDIRSFQRSSVNLANVVDSQSFRKGNA